MCETQVYRFLLDAYHGYISVGYLLTIARRHKRGGKLVTEAYNWGLIDKATYNAWIVQV